MLFALSATVISPIVTDSLGNKEYNIETSLVFTSSVRALDVVNDSTIAFSGYGGLIGVTLTAGDNWDTTRISVDDITPAFRACAIVGDDLVIASTESPGLILKGPIYDLAKMEVKYRDDNPTVFLDAMAFSNDGYGVVMGDPTDGCLTIIVSNDKGEVWKRVPCDRVPDIIDGEAAFAASNGNISIIGGQTWIATGGKASRVFHSDNRGRSWEAHSTPLLQGGSMTGAFAVSFISDKEGLLIGGDWENKQNNNGNIAHSIDGGKTWQLVSEGTGPGYRSSIIWRPGHDGECVAIGSEGIDLSKNSGSSWTNISEQGFYTGRFSPDGKVLWLAGHGSVSKLEFE